MILDLPSWAFQVDATDLLFTRSDDDDDDDDDDNITTPLQL